MKRIFALLLALLLLAGCTAPAQPPEVPEMPAAPETPEAPAVPEAPEEPPAPETVTVTLCYPDKEFIALEKEERTITLTGKGAEWDVLDALYAGPAKDTLMALLGGTPADILSVKTENGLCTVDLSGAFVQQNTGGSTREGWALSSIVNALCSLEGIDKVKFNVEGNTAAEYGGHFTLDEPFEPMG